MKQLSLDLPILSRLLLLIAGPFLILCLLFHLIFHAQEIRSSQGQLTILEKKLLAARNLKERDKALQKRLFEGSSFSVDKELESLTFLSPDKKKNHLVFIEEETRKKDRLLEVEERQEAPIVMSQEELKKVLSLLEGVAISPYIPPKSSSQIVISSFDLSKKRVDSSLNGYQVSMKIVKREAAP